MHPSSPTTATPAASTPERLQTAGFLTAAELDAAETRLARDRARPRTVPVEADEDVHSAIERQLGDLGRKIHAGRSRNDQVAAAFRLYVLAACRRGREEIEALAMVVALASPRPRPDR